MVEADKYWGWWGGGGLMLGLHKVAGHMAASASTEEGHMVVG
jgi:hypothetical protein